MQPNDGEEKHITLARLSVIIQERTAFGIIIHVHLNRSLPWSVL